MYSQSEILRILRKEGYDVSLRTLRYWRSQGLLGQLENRKYGIWICEDIKELCHRFGRLVGDRIFEYIIEGHKFSVYKYIVEKPKEYTGNFRLTFYTDKGIIIEKRDNLDELLG